jgi:hypothetical protein
MTCPGCTLRESGDAVDGCFRTLNVAVAVRVPNGTAEVGVGSDAVVSAAKLAVESYRLAGVAIETSARPVDADAHYERAARLAKQFDRKGDQLRQQLDFILGRSVGMDVSRPGTGKLLSILYELRHGDPGVLGNRAVDAANSRRKSGNFDAARNAYDLAAKFFHRYKDGNAAEAARVASAETYVEEADRFASGLGAHNALRAAILAFEKIPALKERVPALKARLREAGQSVLAGLSTIEHRENVTAIVQETRRRISGQALEDALFRLAFNVDALEPAVIRESVEKTLADHPLQGIFDTTVLDSAGRMLAVVKGIFSGTPEEIEVAMQHHMHRHADLFYRNYILQTRIGPALGVIRDEHSVEDYEGQIEKFVEGHPLIADGHGQYFVRGLAEGLKGDFVLALHLLVPQVENALRVLLHGNGVITTDLKGLGIEQEWTLGKVLDHPALEEALLPAMVFELKDRMLANPAGANFRSNLAHGLLAYDGARSADSVYLWWIILRLVLGTSPLCDAIAERQRQQ